MPKGRCRETFSLCTVDVKFQITFVTFDIYSKLHFYHLFGIYYGEYGENDVTFIEAIFSICRVEMKFAVCQYTL